MNKQFLIWCFIINSVFCLEKFLQFIPHEEVTERKTVYELNNLPVNIDAFQNNQILIKFIQYIEELYFPQINFFCHVKTLDQNYEIKNAALCKREYLLAKEDCHSINKDTTTIKFGDLMAFDIKYESTIGIRAILSMDMFVVKQRLKPFDGFYYCKLGNLLGAVSSNYFEIQDYEFYKKKLSTLIIPLETEKFLPTPLDDIRSDSFPIYLDCGRAVGNLDREIPKWVDKDLISAFRWNICPKALSGIGCFSAVIDTQAKKSPAMEDFINFYKHPNGSVILMGMKNTEYTKFGIVCKDKMLPMPSAIYMFKITNKISNPWRSVNYISTGQYSKLIQKISPSEVDITIREGMYQFSPFKLYASYIANPDHTKVSAEWTINGYSLPSDFITGAYQLRFPAEITESHMGTYNLKVSQSEPYNSVVFKYSVKVLGVPKLEDSGKFPAIIYRTVDQSVNISASFQKSIIKQRILINGIPIDFSSEPNKETSLKGLSFQFPFLTGIAINANFDTNQAQGLFHYMVTNLHRNKNAPQPKTHTVTLEAENEIGISKKSFLIRVFDNPQFKNYLNNFNCTSNCRNNEKHEFKCSIDETDYLSEGCTIKYLWELNGLSLNSMDAKYDQKVYLEIRNDTLIINPIKSDNPTRDERMVKTLTDATLSCQVIIYEPVKTGEKPSIKLYSTQNNPVLKPFLEAKINLQVNSIDTAATSWILPLVISLIVVVIIVVLSLYFCLRGSGETYNVDQKERAHGHDPEKEIRDNEIFQPYERDHETNVVQPSHLSFNDDDSVGVGSDDGELDVYDIDPGKFNEEGSFIGQYASDPRKHKANNV